MINQRFLLESYLIHNRTFFVEKCSLGVLKFFGSRWLWLLYIRTHLFTSATRPGSSSRLGNGLSIFTPEFPTLFSPTTSPLSK